ncbi:dihydromonapterin reductase [Pseudoalteromonas ulvae]|uniref:Dihydromonapterin reductase n=1 Tax=Pseudoalteromonas ulvae TaxID=107327 RepID=A0A2D0A0C5_PSEDV|nr:dihydromonapterin reductase [Pseudoalteromonas ulvae]OUL56125.1 dihydromonapterin reductase [Pseudoalteromonas ulvae]
MQSPILITGAGQRIGLALAKSLLANKQPLIVTYRTRHNSIDELEAAGVKCIEADFTSDEAIADFITQLKRTTSSLRAIIHNASSWDCEGNNPDFAQLFDNMMRIHAKVPYLINMACAQLLQNSSAEHSDIIHLTDYVVEKGSPKHIAYAASKAALDNLTKSFAAQLAPKVKVNSIAPSLIIFNEHDSAQYREKTLKKSILGLEPGSQEIVNTVALLLNSHYITGRTLPVDGGRHLK